MTFVMPDKFECIIRKKRMTFVKNYPNAVFTAKD
jgi:hypothetical protein